LRALLALVFALNAAAPPPVAADIYPRLQIVGVRQHADVRVRLTVERDERNRALAWAWDSANFSGSSARSIERADAPRTYTIWLKALLPGEYTFTVVLSRTDGERRLVEHFSVIGDTEP